ncbi:hypothetical protein [Pedosphaera parvula]|uniref:Uncharacterized protein n=1 Tax=Pedosphaera parvula (strain Ellin514) TaxID=320771 RepID=B9XMG7_PEDPL|nr:hypothetical protein [Pedosphaera parvula]EEF59009.1 hypothetical protein Cflav_PD2058 [Pedosphaera parvula Ellin514]
MKSFRLLIIILGAAVVFALVAMVWQARTIRNLRTEEAALREDLRSTLAVALDKTPTSAAEQAQRERLELIKLRHETRDLRERLAEARAQQPTGFKGLIRSLLSSHATPPLHLRPEYKGLEKNLTNTYAQAMRGVNNGTNEYVRFLSLHTAAKTSLAMGRTEEARRFAEDAMTLNEKYSHGSPEKASGDVVHDANLVLGRIAVEEGRLEDAKRHLLAAGHNTGSPVLGSFGPNMGLAKDLLEHGEPATVLEYFELCRKFWGENAKLDEWKKEVEAGRIPDFGGNLIY